MFQFQDFVMLIASLCIVVLGSSLAAASQSDNRLQEALMRLETAYGGEGLRSLDHVRIEADRRIGWPGQGQTAQFEEYVADRLVKHFNFDDEWGSVERWTLQNGGAYHNAFVFDGDQFASIDYGRMTYTLDPETGFNDAFLGDFRSSDLLLARLLTQDTPEVRWVESRGYSGHDHDVLEVRVDEDVWTVLVSKSDGLIRWVSFERPIGTITLVFSNHEHTQGFAHAGETHVFMNDRMTEYEREVRYSFTPTSPDQFALGNGLNPQEAWVDTSQMTVDVLAEGVFMVGQGDYSLFARDGDGLIGINTYPGFAARYEALVEFLGERPSLDLAVVTHHHTDHMEAMDEAVALGATLVMSAETEQEVRNGDWPGISAEHVRVVEDEDRVGPFQVLLMSTPHGTGNALMLHGASGVLFQDDHYHPLAQDGAYRIQPSAAFMKEALEERGVTPRYLVAGHARKAEPWSVFAGATEQLSETDLYCPSRRAICQSTFMDE